MPHCFQVKPSERCNKEKEAKIGREVTPNLVVDASLDSFEDGRLAMKPSAHKQRDALCNTHASYTASIWELNLDGHRRWCLKGDGVARIHGKIRGAAVHQAGSGNADKKK